MPDDQSQKGSNFWTSMPGILAGIAAVLTASGGLIALLKPGAPRLPTPDKSAVVGEPSRAPAGGEAAETSASPRKAAMSAGKMSAEEPGVERKGRNYKEIRTDDVQACIEACKTDVECRAVTFKRETKWCLMKDVAGTPADDKGSVSAMKVGP